MQGGVLGTEVLIYIYLFVFVGLTRRRGKISCSYCFLLYNLFFIVYGRRLSDCDRTLLISPLPMRKGTGGQSSPIAPEQSFPITASCVLVLESSSDVREEHASCKQSLRGSTRVTLFTAIHFFDTTNFSRSPIIQFIPYETFLHFLPLSHRLIFVASR